MEEVVLAGFPVLEVDVVGRRAAAVVPELEAGFFREEAAEAVDFVLGEVVAAAAAGLGASSCWTTSKLPASDMIVDDGGTSGRRRGCRRSGGSACALSRSAKAVHEEVLGKGSRVAAGIGRDEGGK